MWVYVCVCVCTYVCLRLYVCMCMYVRVYVYVCACVLGGDAGGVFQFPDRPALLRQSLRSLGVGTFKDLATARMDTPLIHVLDIFAARRISCVPVVDDQGQALTRAPPHSTHL
jgi:hypothetical protein